MSEYIIFILFFQYILKLIRVIMAYNGLYQPFIKVGKMKSFFTKLVKKGQYRGTIIIDRLFTNFRKKLLRNYVFKKII